MKKTKVMFLGTTNATRGQMVEAFLRKYAEGDCEVYSAGLHPTEIHPYTIHVMEEVGLDLSGHTTKDLPQFLGIMHFGYLVNLCEVAETKCPVFPGMGMRAYWSLDNPAKASCNEEEKLAKFRQVRNRVEAHVQSWVKELGFTSVSEETMP